MKQLLGLAVLGSLLAQTAVAWAEPVWNEVTVNAVGDRFLVDRNSIETRGDSVWYWEYRDFRQPNNAFVEETIEEPVYGVMLYRSVDCASNVVRLRQLIAHDRQRQQLGRFSYGDTGSLSEPMAGSSAAAVVRYVCSQRPAPAEATSPRPAR